MTLEHTQRRRHAVGTVHDIVNALRAIAAGRISGAQRALQGAQRYQSVVLRALAAFFSDTEIANRDSEPYPLTLLVMTSEQPLCGPFNQKVLEFAKQRWQELSQHGPVRLIVVGGRGLRLLGLHGMTPDDSEPAATSLEGTHDLVKRLARLLGRRYAAGEFRSLHVLYNRYQSVSEQVPTEERILPLDLALVASSAAPRPAKFQRYLTTANLLAGLISEYAFISLFRIALDSFASEQASRLLAMDGSTRNSERLLADLTDLERRERQGEITRQVLELVAARFSAE